jgi:hypothetical protein
MEVDLSSSRSIFEKVTALVGEGAVLTVLQQLLLICQEDAARR